MWSTMVHWHWLALVGPALVGIGQHVSVQLLLVLLLVMDLTMALQSKEMFPIVEGVAVVLQLAVHVP